MAKITNGWKSAMLALGALALAGVATLVAQNPQMANWEVTAYDTGATVPGQCGPGPAFFIKSSPLQLNVCNPATGQFVSLATLASGSLIIPANFTVTAPSANISIIGGSLAECSTTAACPSTAETTMHVVQGIGLMASGSPSTYAVTTISPAFTSSTSYNCVAQDVSTIANNIGVLTAGYVSGSAVTFTGPNSNTDTFRFTCVGY